MLDGSEAMKSYNVDEIESSIMHLIFIESETRPQWMHMGSSIMNWNLIKAIPT